MRRLSAFSAILFLFGAGLLPPLPLHAAGGEDCASATLIPALPFVDSGNTCGALDDYNESCPFLPTGGRDVVYRFTPAVDLTIAIDLCTSGYDTKVYVYAGSCPSPGNSGLAIGCNDDFCGVNTWRSRLLVTLAGGVEHFIVVDGYGGPDCGDYDLSIAEFVPLAGDTCATAEVITLPFSGVISTVGATDDYNEDCPFPETGAPDVVRQFVATSDGVIEIDLCPSLYDTKVYVYEGACPAAGSAIGAAGSGTELVCNDDACGVQGFRSRIPIVPVTAGETYFVVFDGWGASDFGDAIVSISELPPPGPGDTCEEAFPIPALPFSMTGTTLGGSWFEHSCQFIFTGVPEHFFSYTAPVDQWLEIDTCGSDFDTELTVISGSCPIPLEPDPALVFSCNDDGCGVDATRARIAAQFVAAGETITIVVDGHAPGDEGEYSILVRETCPPDHPSELVSVIDVENRPIGTVVHEGTGRLFVANYGSGSISVIDTATDTVEATLPVNAGPYRLAITPDGTRLYIVCFVADTIDCIDPWTLAPIASFSAQGLNPLGLAFSSDSSTLFVSTEGDGTVTKWSIPGHQNLGEVSGLGAARELIAGPGGEYVYLSDPSGVRVWRIDTETLVAESLDVDEFPQALAVTEDGTHLLVGNFGFDRSLDHASVIDLHAWQLVARLRVGTGPEEMVVVPGTPYLAVTNWGFSHHPNSAGPLELGSALGNVAIVRLPDFATVGDPITPPMIDAIEMIIPAGGDYTFGIAVTANGEKIYAANSGYPGPAVADSIGVITFPGGLVSGRFVRGDANADGAIDIADPIAALDHLFGGGALACPNAADANDDEALDIADPIALLATLFTGAGPIPPPVTCGVDRTAGDLCCDPGCAP